MRWVLGTVAEGGAGGEGGGDGFGVLGGLERSCFWLVFGVGAWVWSVRRRQVAEERLFVVSGRC